MSCVRCHRELPEGALFCPFCGKRQGPTTPRRPAARRAPGTGNVHKLPGNRAKPYAARVGQRVIGVFATEGEAICALDSFRAQNARAALALYTFAECYGRWSERLPELDSKTADGYRRAFDAAAELHGQRMRDIRTDDYQRIIDGLVAAGKSYSACQKQNGLHHQLCSWAMQNDIISRNYAEFVRLPAKPGAKDRVLSDQELATLRSVADNGVCANCSGCGLAPGLRGVTAPGCVRAARLMLVMAWSGMRINELLTLRSEDVHLADGYVVGGEKTAAGRGRIIPVHPCIRSYVAAWLAAGGSYLVSSAADTPLDYAKVRRQISRLCSALGMHDVTAHTCRHTAATRMAEAGLPTKVIQAVLGHASYSTTAEIYTHPQVASLVAAVAAMPGSGTGMAQAE